MQSAVAISALVGTGANTCTGPLHFVRSCDSVNIKSNLRGGCLSSYFSEIRQDLKSSAKRVQIWRNRVSVSATNVL